MPRYVIERDLPAAGGLTVPQLEELARKSCDVLDGLGPSIQWVQTYVTDSRLYCTYIAPNEEIVREHARRGGFPLTRIAAVRALIDPTTARS